MYECMNSRHRFKHLYENHLSGNDPRSLEKRACTLKEDSANCSYLEGPVTFKMYGVKFEV